MKIFATNSNLSCFGDLVQHLDIAEKENFGL